MRYPREMMRACMVVVLLCGVMAACGGGQSGSGPGQGTGGLVNGGLGAGGTVVTTTVTNTGGSGAASSSSSSSSSSGHGGSAGGCVDIGIGEQNESEETAFKLKAQPIDDCDGSGDTVSGTIAGPSDVDWFYYRGDDSATCIVDPTRDVNSGDSNLRICAYFECLSGNTTFSCPSGTTADTSPLGRAGCCNSSGFSVTNLNCTGTLDESVFAYIRVDVPGADAATCSDYTLAYHY